MILLKLFGLGGTAGLASDAAPAVAAYCNGGDTIVSQDVAGDAFSSALTAQEVLRKSRPCRRCLRASYLRGWIGGAPGGRGHVGGDR